MSQRIPVVEDQGERSRCESTSRGSTRQRTRYGKLIAGLYSVGLLVTLTLGIPSTLPVLPIAEAQPHSTIPLVGFLRHGRQADARLQERLDAFRQGLSELGYIEGQNLVLDVRYFEGHLDRLPELAVEFVRLPVDVLVVHGPQGVRAARDATSTIPIVMARMFDGAFAAAHTARVEGAALGLAMPPSLLFQADEVIQ